MKTTMKETKKLAKTNGRKPLRDEDYETAEQVRSLDGKYSDLSSEAKKMCRLFRRAMGLTVKNLK